VLFSAARPGFAWDPSPSKPALYPSPQRKQGNTVRLHTPAWRRHRLARHDRLEDQRGDHRDEHQPNEPGATADGEPRAKVAAHHIGHGHGNHEVPPDVAGPAEEREGGKVGHHVEHLRAGDGVEKIEAEHSDEEEDEEASGAGAEKAVIEAEEKRDQRRQDRFRGGRVFRCMRLAEVLRQERVDERERQHHRQQSAEPVCGDQGHEPGPGKAADDRSEAGGEERFPWQSHMSRVVGGGPGRAPDHGGLTGAKQRRGRGGGEDAEEDWDGD